MIKGNASRGRRRTWDTIPGAVLLGKDTKTSVCTVSYFDIILPAAKRNGSFLPGDNRDHTILLGGDTISIASTWVHIWCEKNIVHNASYLITSESYGSDPSGESRRCNRRVVTNNAYRITSRGNGSDPSGESRRIVSGGNCAKDIKTHLGKHLKTIHGNNVPISYTMLFEVEQLGHRKPSIYITTRQFLISVGIDNGGSRTLDLFFGFEGSCNTAFNEE